ncbi:MAG: type 2 isopentenyl-diphosphate Delta-isomerase [Candidatus Bathyarchaeota archaeon]|nr:type 2 isopentenyl-diphosphate Delta-isomerase [Candidatus Bathyarchaeota archaeon]
MGQESLKGGDREGVGRIINRKGDHIRICLERDVEAKKITTGFEDVFLLHKALPELNLNDVRTETVFLNHNFSAPIIVEGMTGGTEESMKINAAIAQAVEELGLGMGVGSQRAALEDPSLERTYRIVREKAPKAFMVSNIGAPQLTMENSISKVKRAVEMIEADALAIHLNPLQEVVQPEGEKIYAGIVDKIGLLAGSLNVPIIVKETGGGISAEVAKMLEDAGVACIDVAGAGGTSWAAVEYYRAVEQGFHLNRDLGLMLWDWGIPTVVSLVEVIQSVKLPVIASGGIRSGLDVAKSIALGASLAGIAKPILIAASKGYEETKSALNSLITQLRSIMFLVGAASIEKLKRAPLVILGRSAEWLRARGFNPEIYARRRM